MCIGRKHYPKPENIITDNGVGTLLELLTLKVDAPQKYTTKDAPAYRISAVSQMAKVRKGFIAESTLRKWYAHDLPHRT